MTTTYKPKHKRPESWGGSTPRGPKRWARAAHNALIRPNSNAGMLYLDRVTNAHTIRKHYSDEGPSEHMGYEHRYSNGWKSEYKRQYATCSLFCTAMVAQLDRGVRSYEDLVRVLQDDETIRFLDRSTLTRDVQCYCCGGTIKAKR